jgi:hypothetical protein
MTGISETFDSEAGYRQAIDATLAAASTELRIFDRDTERMALDAPARAARLAAFLAAEKDRRLRIVVHDPRHLQQRCPRLIALARRYGHAVEIRQTPDHLRHLADCQVLADARHGTLRTHADHPRGRRIADDDRAIHPWWQRFDELWAASEPCSLATVIGL